MIICSSAGASFQSYVENLTLSIVLQLNYIRLCQCHVECVYDADGQGI